MSIPSDLVLFVKYLEEASVEGFFNGVGRQCGVIFTTPFSPTRKEFMGE